MHYSTIKPPHSSFRMTVAIVWMSEFLEALLYFCLQELREDNAILTESKAMLEEHLSSSHKRIETVVELEKELMKYRQQIEEMATVRLGPFLIIPPAKRSFRGVYCFQHVRDSEIPSTFKAFAL